MQMYNSWDSFDTLYRFNTCYSAHTIVVLSDGFPYLYGWDPGSEDVEYHRLGGPVIDLLKANDCFASTYLDILPSFISVKAKLPADMSAFDIEARTVGCTLERLFEKQGIQFVYLVGRKVSLDRLVQL
jgi:hypothetical protein